ncbi:hypothetical protein HNP84_008734 [Thermocatellispora tengchongensis]|uniref:Uncharacterized protein n=1 Tax=Thermocatellispora tengchongensis TaxID=1073253 RepID=A0A840PIL5_9ACTN|nr:hypothetical protein [Thermocatellispora tengchongensis]
MLRFPEVFRTPGLRRASPTRKANFMSPIRRCL